MPQMARAVQRHKLRWVIDVRGTPCYFNGRPTLNVHSVTGWAVSATLKRTREMEAICNLENGRKTVTGVSLKAFNLANKTHTHTHAHTHTHTQVVLLYLPALKCLTNRSCVCSFTSLIPETATQSPRAAGRLAAQIGRASCRERV